MRTSNEISNGNCSAGNDCFQVSDRERMMSTIGSLAERPFRVVERLKADCPETFRVSDAARRRKVDGARTRGPHAVRYGDFDFALIPTAADGADKRKGPIAAGPILP